MLGQFTKDNSSSNRAEGRGRKVRAVAVATVLCGVLSACATIQDLSPIPAEAKKPEPRALARQFANHTDNWGQGSGIFYAPDGTWRAVNTTEQSLGLGRWYVTTESRVCSEGNWRWRQDFGTYTDETTTTCRRFRIGPDGQMWSTTEGLDGPWFPFSFASFAPRNQIKGAFARVARQLGLTEQE